MRLDREESKRVGIKVLRKPVENKIEKKPSKKEKEHKVEDELPKESKFRDEEEY